MYIIFYSGKEKLKNGCGDDDNWRSRLTIILITFDYTNGNKMLIYTSKKKRE